MRRKPDLVEMLPSPEEMRQRITDAQEEVRLLKATLKLSRLAADRLHREVHRYSLSGTQR